MVNVGDFLLFLSAFSNEWAGPYDFDGNATIGSADLLVFLTLFGDISACKACVHTTKKPHHCGFFVFAPSVLCCGGQTRTDDLRVMSPTSYQLLHPAISTRCSRKRDSKYTLKFHFAKCIPCKFCGPYLRSAVALHSP